jgi:hypothetical protein
VLKGYTKVCKQGHINMKSNLMTAEQFAKNLEDQFKVLCLISGGSVLGHKAFVRVPAVNIYFHIGQSPDGTIWQGLAISVSKEATSFAEFQDMGLCRLTKKEIREEIRNMYGSNISESAIIADDPE